MSCSRPVNGGICATFDNATGQYIMYLQIMGNENEMAGFPQIGSGRVEVETQRRTVGFSCTADFRKWPAPKLILSPDAQDGLDTCFCECWSLLDHHYSLCGWMTERK